MISHNVTNLSRIHYFIMRPRPGKDVSRPNSRSRGRKILKSPLNIREKIKELDMKMEKEAGRGELRRKKESETEQQIDRGNETPKREENRVKVRVKRVESLDRNTRTQQEEGRRPSFRRRFVEIRSSGSTRGKVKRALSYEDGPSVDSDQEAVNKLKAENEKYK